jgi:hypothetical protein
VLAFLDANVAFLSANPSLLAGPGLTVIQGADALTFGEMVGIALSNPTTVGASIYGQVTNFLEDAAQGTAIYSAPLSIQPIAAPFQGATAASLTDTTTSHIQATGVAAPVDHLMM